MKSNKPANFIFVLFFSMMALSCGTSHSPSERSQWKAVYIRQFKLEYFRALLLKGFNHSQAVQEIIGSDHSGFTEPVLSTSDQAFIDSMTAVDNLKMQKDSIERTGRVAEGAEGKRTLGFIIDKLESKWMDSLANKRFKTSGSNN